MGGKGHHCPAIALETSSQKISFRPAFDPHRSFHAQTSSNWSDSFRPLAARWQR